MVLPSSTSSTRTRALKPCNIYGSERGKNGAAHLTYFNLRDDTRTKEKANGAPSKTSATLHCVPTVRNPGAHVRGSLPRDRWGMTTDVAVWVCNQGRSAPVELGRLIQVSRYGHRTGAAADGSVLKLLPNFVRSETTLWVNDSTGLDN